MSATSFMRKPRPQDLTEPDPFLLWGTKIWAWLKKNQKWLLSGVVVIVVVASMLAFATIHNTSQAEKASLLLHDAQDEYNKAMEPKAASSPTDSQKNADNATNPSAKFSEVVARYPSSGSADSARLYLARLAADSGDASGAEKWYREFLDRAGYHHELSPMAVLGLGAALEDQNKYDAAIAEYQRLLPKEKVKTPPALFDTLLFALATAQQTKGLRQEARATFQRLLSEAPGSSLASKAQSRITELAESKPAK